MYGITFLVYAATLPYSELTGTLLLFLLLAAAISIVLVIGLIALNPSVAAGTASGVIAALVIPFVFLIIVAGLCTRLTGTP